MPGMGLSLILIAAGAILAWGVTADAEGMDVNQIGIILLIVGIVGLLLSALYMGGVPYGPIRRRTVVRDDLGGDTVVRRDTGRTVIREEEIDDAPPPPPRL